MNAIIKKERRALRAAFLSTITTTVLCGLVCRGNEAWGFVILVFSVGTGLMTAGVFGHELHGRTMPLLLSQPIPRSQIWGGKMRVLGLELAACLAVLVLTLALLMKGEARINFAEESFLLLSIPLCAFCSTPYLTLRSKSILGGLVFACIAPFFIVMVCLWADTLLTKLIMPKQDKLLLDLLSERHPGGYHALVTVAWLAYCAIFYRLGRRAFMNLEVVESRQGEVAFPTLVERALGRGLDKFIPGYSGPFSSLVRKELRLHRVSYLMAVFISVAVPLLNALWRESRALVTQALMMIALGFSIFVIPVLIGLVTVTEERSLGLLDSQRMLPVSTRTQWAAKMLVAVFSCLLLGIGLSAALFLLSHKAIDISVPQMNTSLFWMLLPYFAAFSIVVFASSISPNLPRAATAAFGLLIAFSIAIPVIKPWGFKFAWFFPHSPYIDPFVVLLRKFGTPIVTIGGPSCFFLVWIVLTNWFSYLNFKVAFIPANRIWRQLFWLLLFAVLVPFLAGFLSAFVRT